MAAEISIDWTSGAITQRDVQDSCAVRCDGNGNCWEECHAKVSRDVQDSCAVRCNSNGHCWEECHAKKARDVQNAQREVCYYRCTRISCVWECVDWDSAHAGAAKEIEGTVVVSGTAFNDGNVTIDFGVQSSTSSKAGACLHPAMHCFSRHCSPYCIISANAVDAPPATDCREVCDPTKDFCVEVCAF